MPNSFENQYSIPVLPHLSARSIFFDDRRNYQPEEREEETNDDDLDLARYARNPILMGYNCKAQWIPRRQPWEKRESVLMGIELEVNFGDDEELAMLRMCKDSYLTEPNPLACNAFWKTDGSLCSGGAELVTNPMTLQCHSMLGWRKILAKLRANGGSSYDSGECGLHVHINHPGRAVERKLKRFFVANRSFLIEFARRKRLSYCQIPLSDNSFEWHEHGRYVALNNTGKTLEFRIFRGTLGFKRFWASLQLVDSLVLFMRLSSMQGCWKLSNYFNFLETRTEYKHLIDYLKKGSLYKYLQ